MALPADPVDRRHDVLRRQPLLGDLLDLPHRASDRFAAGGRSVLTRTVGRSDSLEIRGLRSGAIRELGIHDRAWWLDN